MEVKYDLLIVPVQERGNAETRLHRAESIDSVD
jgi:hypothetical protein